MGGTESHHNRALQDIVNNLGERLGFGVEYGPYAGAASSIPYDGLWLSDDLDGDPTYFVVETKKSANFADEPADQPGKYMTALRNENDLDNADVFGLTVVGEGDLEPSVDAIRESEYAGRIRVISVQRLLDLLNLKRWYVTSHLQIARLLAFPDVIDADSLVGLIGEFADRTDFWRHVGRGTGIRRDGADIEFNDDLYDKENSANFVQFVFEKGRLTEDDLPIDVGSKRYLSEKPEKENGDSMGSPVEVVDSVYLETDPAVSRKKAFIERWALEHGPRRESSSYSRASFS